MDSMEEVVRSLPRDTGKPHEQNRRHHTGGDKSKGRSSHGTHRQGKEPITEPPESHKKADDRFRTVTPRNLHYDTPGMRRPPEDKRQAKIVISQYIDKSLTEEQRREANRKHEEELARDIRSIRQQHRLATIKSEAKDHPPPPIEGSKKVLGTTIEKKRSSRGRKNQQGETISGL
ncbi:hypothetical protein ACET3Z_018257 [Daucus carota]